MQRLPEGALLVPAKLAPGNHWLDHALFAIKHEGVQLDYLTAALRQVGQKEMEAEFLRTPNGAYVRKLCLLWEAAHQRPLQAVEQRPVAAAYVPMFDPAAYLTGASRRNARWRVDFNGLGDLAFCPVVRKTDAVLQGLQHDVLAHAKAFAASIGPQMLERALSWAYLSETEGSFAIEGEIPSEDKASRFAALLKRAHNPRPLTEGYLIELQNATVSNPFDQATQFRTEQNRLQGNALGAAGVTYVPPQPELCAALMEQLMALSNRRPAGLDPLAHAGLVSFAFVFLHPFMDGNGRLSRFLIHHCLGQSGALPAGFLLPVSVAMKKHEEQYWQALTTFSRPARELCQVLWSGDDQYSYTWQSGEDVWFRYMDVTEGVAFTLAMAKASLEIHLRQEVEFLGLFDDVARYINDRHDLRGTDLATLIVTTYQNGGKLSNNRRKRFADRVQAHVLHEIEAAVARRMQSQPLPGTEDED
ncbi:MAG TPA: cell filamentation protein Fic [Comamonadaceae bacterium]|nr:cell filamentation protein Fic [Comamonadaceae bacterium]